LDTRTKIVPSFETSEAKTVVGYFDPMHAGHVRRLRELCEGGSRLNVVIADPPEPIMGAQARAELVAALDCVAAVVIANSADLEGAHIIDERTADAARSLTFAQHVLARHNTK
jgi:cytidyltransferase-like protein